MHRIIISVFCYLVVGLPAGWLVWHFSAGLPVAARVACLVALALGMADGARRRRARKPQTFRDLVG
jgi:hypothetical protein